MLESRNSHNGNEEDADQGITITKDSKIARETPSSRPAILLLLLFLVLMPVDVPTHSWEFRPSGSGLLRAGWPSYRPSWQLLHDVPVLHVRVRVETTRRQGQGRRMRMSVVLKKQPECLANIHTIGITSPIDAIGAMPPQVPRTSPGEEEQ